MILYTIVPEHFIYPTEEAVFTKQRFVSHNGVDMLVEMGDNHEYSVVRVLSSDPDHFMQYAPGQKVWIH